MLTKLKRRSYQYLLLLRPALYFLIAAGLIIFVSFFVFKLKPLLGFTKIINPAINNLASFKSRTNFLLLGIGGGTHEGADLTDSLMLISVDLKTSDTVLISLPRDIWIESLAAKLNTAYYYGEQKEPGGGLVLAKSAVAEITNQPIHYAALLDFSGFAKVIDALGGITVNVPRGFIDNQYPIPGQEAAEPESARYESISFAAGEQNFDGQTALKYVRSRHADGEEGSDFSRAQRQQLVILAFKDKLLSPAVWLNPSRFKRIYQNAKSAIRTDLPSNAYPDLLKLGLRIKSAGLRTGVIDQGSFNEEIPALLYNPPSSLYGQWVLLPVNNNWQAVYDHVAEIIYQNQ